MANDLRLNEWLTPQNQRFSYRVKWHYQEPINPNQDTVDVDVRYQEQNYIGTFVTVDEIKKWFQRFKENGDCANGSYVTLGKNLVLEKITHPVIERTIDDLIKNEEFLKHFEEVDE